MLAAGKSYREVAETVGVRVPTIYDWAMRPERSFVAPARKPSGKKAGSGVVAPPTYHRGMRWGDRLE
jgi:transposase